LAADLDRLEEIEKATLRLVTQAIDDFSGQAAVIFAAEKDRVADIGEDLTREALDRLGVSKIEQRIFGKMDYKRPRYVFEPAYAVRQAMLVDSKAEAADAQDTATLQTAQTSLRIRHMRSGAPTDEAGTLPAVITTGGGLKLLSTTVFVKYNYTVTAGTYNLASATVAALPNGMLQARYNPTAADTIWRTGRNAPTRGEPFRARLVFAWLKAKASWRVQSVPMGGGAFAWVD
jgi:hypothetical protein